MIVGLKGILAEKRPDFAVIDVNGVFYGLSIPLSTFERLPQEGEEVRLHTLLVHKEDRMDLFGFKDRDDLELFRILLGVNGIGPKLALTVLSRLAPEELESAVAAQDVSRFKGISGIGAKTAEKIVFELKGKFKHARSPAGSTGSSGDDMLDLRLALQSLGYTAQEIDRALRSPEIRKAVTLEDRIRAGLTLLAGGRKL